MPPKTGWEPQVGAGQDVWEPGISEEERRKRMAAQGWDPLRRAREVAEAWRIPPVGLFETAVLPFEAAGAGFKYLGGVATGVQHAVQEWGLGRKLTEEERTRDYTFVGGKRTSPEVRDIFDPTEAVARYEAGVNPAVQVGADILVGTKGIGVAAKVAKAGISAAARRAGLIGGEAVPLVESPAVARLRATGTVLGHPATRVGAAVGIPAWAAAPEFAREEPGRERSVIDRTVESLPNALAGLFVGGAAAWSFGRVGRAAQQAAKEKQFAVIPEDASENTANFLRTQHAIRQAREGAAPPDFAPTYHPGGWPRVFWDALRQQFSDRIAHFETWQRRVEHVAGRKLTEDENALLIMRNIFGVQYEAGERVNKIVRPIFEGLGKASPLSTHKLPDGRTELQLFDDFMLATLAEIRLARGFRTGRQLGTKEQIDDALRDHTRWIAERYGQDAPLQWRQAALDITEKFHNPILDAEEAAGLLVRGGAAKAKERVEIFGRLQSTKEAIEADAARGLPRGRMYITEISDVDRWHDATKDVTFSLVESLRYAGIQMERIERAKVGRALMKWRDLDPGGFGKVFRPVAAPIRSAKDMERLASWQAMSAEEQAALHPSTRRSLQRLAQREEAVEAVPPGWDAFKIFDAGKSQQWMMPRMLSDVLLGFTGSQVDMVTRIMGAAGNPFRVGVTALSIPFLLGNLPRDYQAAMQNLGGGTPLVRNLLQGTFEALTGGLDDFMRRHQSNEAILRLPQRVLSGLDNAVLGKQGRVLPQYIESGAGFGLTRQLTGPKSVERELGVEGYREGIAGRIPVVGEALRTPGDVIAAISNATELSNRLGVFRYGLEKGMTAKEAGGLARGGIVDFSKGGEATKVLSLWMPLLNARIQGQLRSFEAAAENPEAFTARLAAVAVVPTIATWAVNRVLWGDLYDKIPLEVRDRYFMLIVGEYTDDRGERKPVTLRLPKNEVTGLVSTPVEHFLDAVLHAKHGEAAALTGGQRTERSEAQAWLSGLARLVPLNVNGDDLFNPGEYAVASITMAPLIGTISQMWANHDHFRDRPIIDDEDLRLPTMYQGDEDTPSLSYVLSRALKNAGIEDPRWSSPAKLAFAVRGLFGTYGEMVLGGASDLFDAAKTYGLPLPEARPTTLADLQLPKGLDAEKFAELFDRLPREDRRPWYARVVPRLIGSAGGGQTILAKMRQMPEEDRRVWDDTRGLYREYQEVLVRFAKVQNEILEKAQTESWTHSQLIERLDDLSKERSGAFETLREQKYPRALTDPRERQAFISRLPGVPIGSEFARATGALPEGTDIAQLAERHRNPPGADMAVLSEVARGQARRRELHKMSQELGAPVQVIRDYIAAHVTARTLPAMTVPALWIEEAINRYRRPRGRDGGEIDDIRTVAPEELRLLRRLEVRRLSQQWGIDEGELLERIQSRFTSPEEQHPLRQSLEKAYALSAEVRDPDRFPLFVDTRGNKVGMESEWPLWEAQIDAARRVPDAARPPQVRQLDRMRRNAEVRRIAYLSGHPDYRHFARWFGAGREMTAQMWDDFQEGRAPKYRIGKPEQWMQWDALVRLYNALPADSPRKAALAGRVSTIKQYATKGWRGVLEIDEAARRTEALGGILEQLAGGR